MNKTLRNAFLLLAVLFMSAACIRRDLNDPNELVRIRIKINVNAITNVTTNIRESVKPYGSNFSLWEPKIAQLDPKMMRVLVYDPRTDRLLTQSFVSNEEVDSTGTKVFTGTLGISHGDYNFLVYNFDTPTTQVTSENSENSILAYTNEISPSVKAAYMGTRGKEDEDPYADVSIRYEPEHLMVANKRDVRISPHDTLVVIETEARTVIDTYYIQIRVDGLQFASSATAVISGLSPSNHIGLNERTVDPSAAVVFEMQKGQDMEIPGENKDVLCAVFNTFGKINEISSNLFVTFNVYDTAGKLRQYTANLDTVFDSELAHLYNWLIIEDTHIVIPDPHSGQTEQSDGGFRPVVDDWDEKHENIVL